MTPAEANLHDIAAAFCAPPIVRERCSVCDGRGKVACSTLARPEYHVETCLSCNGRGYVVADREETR